MSSGGGVPAPENAAKQETFSARKSSPDLLREVLEATLARGAGEMSAEECQQLQAVARMHRSSQLDMSEVAELLVAALLATRFPPLASPEANRQMCQRIAASLCGDPTSMQRLKVFWNQLRQSVT
jgi:hypothetical protein